MLVAYPEHEPRLLLKKDNLKQFEISDTLPTCTESEFFEVMKKTSVSSDDQFKYCVALFNT